MRVSQRAAVFLLGVALWNVVTYLVFTKNLFWSGERDEPTGYYVAHGVLIVVNIAIAAVLGPMGWRALRASRESAARESAEQ